MLGRKVTHIYRHSIRNRTSSTSIVCPFLKTGGKKAIQDETEHRKIKDSRAYKIKSFKLLNFSGSFSPEKEGEFCI